MSTTVTHHRHIVIVRGGTAGISAAARLLRALKQPDVTIIEPASEHYYQLLWTLVGAGAFRKEATRREERKLIPRAAGEPDVIQTVRGSGYQLKEPEQC